MKIFGREPVVILDILKYAMLILVFYVPLDMGVQVAIAAIAALLLTGTTRQQVTPSGDGLPQGPMGAMGATGPQGPAGPPGPSWERTMNEPLTGRINPSEPVDEWTPSWKQAPTNPPTD